MTQTNGKGTIENRNILDHLDKLTPVKGGGKYEHKYICPVCEGNNLSVRQKDGAFQCFSNQCDTKAILDAISPLSFKPDGTIPAKSKPKAKTAREKRKAMNADAVQVECEVEQLAIQVIDGNETLERALVTLSAWCKQHGHDKFAATQLLRAQVKEVKSLRGTVGAEEEVRILREYRLIEKHFGERLRFNKLSKEIELDGNPFAPCTAKIDLVVNHGLSLKGCREDIADSIVMIAKNNSYSPVLEYLNRVSERHGNDTSIILNGIATRYFGTTETLYDILLMRFLISCVARAYKPGCKNDCALILQGAGGTKKSTFFKILASEPWFDDTMGDSSDKDERLKLHSVWIAEWAELETVFSRKDASQVKAFLSCSTDRVRPPYGRSTEVLPRASVMVGTTNQDDFLIDSTGNRRFWVISVPRRINLELLAQERDQIWAAAVSLYRQGEPWYLSDHEEEIMEEERKKYEFQDVWHDKVAHYVRHEEAVCIQDILSKAIEMELSRQDVKSSRRVMNILRRLGWRSTNNARVVNGTRRKVWMKI